jgi:hypothetical protein
MWAIDFQDATKALAKIGNRVKIDNATTTLTYGQAESFLPAYVSSQWTITGHTAGALCEYRDQNLYCEVIEASTAVAESEKANHEVTGTIPQVTKPKVTPAAKEEDDLDAFYADMSSILDEDDNDESIFSVPKPKAS